jgi:hypothetical protein
LERRERCEKASADNGATPGRYNSYGDGDVVVVARVNNEEKKSRPWRPLDEIRGFVTPTSKKSFIVQKAIFHQGRYISRTIHLFVYCILLLVKRRKCFK